MVNIAGQVWTIADTDPDRLVLRTFEKSWTYEEMRSAGRTVNGAVRASGLQPLDRVLFIAPTVPEFPIVYYGLHAAGVTVITMNTMSTPAEIGYVLDDSAASLVVAWHESAGSARSAAADRGIDVWEVAAGAMFDAEPMVEVHQHNSDDTAVILYTSGTTGSPKGAELTASNLVETTHLFEPVLSVTKNDRWGTALPLFHVYGQAVVMNLALSRKIPMSLLSPFDPIAMLTMIRDHELTALSGVPTMWNAMLHAEEEFEPGDFSTLRLATSGGASLPVEVLRAFSERFGCVIVEGYGLTETTGASTFNDVTKTPKPGTVGPVLPGSFVQIRDDAGAVLPAGEVGEVFVKGPMVMKGYWNRPDATAQVLQDGWLRTGDLGFVDDDGFLSIVDRLKDLVIRGGYNVYPREVEEVLYEHPAVVEVAVVGVPDDHFGEEIAAIIVLQYGADVDAVSLKAWTKERLSAYKVPRLYQFVAELPKGSTGKILKRGIDRNEIRDHADRAPRG